MIDLGSPHLLFWHGPVPVGQGAALDASGEKLWLVFAAPEACTIDRLTFKALAVTAGGDYKARVETVNTAGNGQPSGTLLAANAESAAVTVSATGLVNFDLIAPVAVTKGQIIAVALQSVGTGNISWYQQNTSVGTVIPTGWNNTSGSMAASANVFPQLGVRKDDGDYLTIFGVVPQDSTAALAISSGTTPDEYGLKLTVPIGCRVSGLWVQHGDGSWPDTADFVLYADDGTVLATKSYLDDMIEQGATARTLLVTFDTPVELDAGDVVRAVVKPTSASTTATLYQAILPVAGMNTAYPHGGAGVRTQRTDGGAWSDSALEYTPMGLIIDGVAEAGGGGGKFAHAHFG